MYSGRKFDYTPYTKIANELIIQLYWHKHSLRCYMVALYTPCRVGVSYGCESDYLYVTYWLCSNIFEKRYNLTEQESTSDASFLLAGSVFLYPIVRFYNY